MKKTLVALTLSVLVLGSVPLVSRAEPVIILTIVGAAVGVDFLSCDFNVIWGCDDDGGGSAMGGDMGGSPAPEPVPTPCTSAPNSCGMTSTGFIQTTAITVAGSITNNSCEATPPPDSSCPPPTIGAGAFTATPAFIGPGISTTLSWNVDNVTTCTISSDSNYRLYPLLSPR